MTNPRESITPWWMPEELSAHELRVRSGESPDANDVKNDFASYKALRSGLDPLASGLFLHNEWELWRIDTMCRDYAAIVRACRGRDPHTVADLGCGAGFTTGGLQRAWPLAKVTGLEVSFDAVQFARGNWPTCMFVDGAIKPSQLLVGSPFDLLLCQEFYPFTRTGSIADHREWVLCLLNNMSNGGLAIIMVAASTYDSINDTYAELRREFTLHRVQVAVPRISRRLPLVVSRVVAMLLRDVRPGWVRNLYVLQH